MDGGEELGQPAVPHVLQDTQETCLEEHLQVDGEEERRLGGGNRIGGSSETSSLLIVILLDVVLYQY